MKDKKHKITIGQRNFDVLSVWFNGMPVQNGVDGKETKFASFVGKSDFEGYVKVEVKNNRGEVYVSDWLLSRTFASK